MKINKILILFCALSFGSIWASDFSVGVVDTKHIIQSSSRLKTASAQLKNRFNQRSQLLLAERKVWMADLEKSRKDGPVLSAQKKAAIHDALLKREQTLRKKQLAFSQQVMKAQQQVMNGVYSDLKSIAARLAKTQKLSLVLDQTGEVLYVNPTYNLTTAVKKQFK
jgi:Skp family chaperone for outer membrane proteins